MLRSGAKEAKRAKERAALIAGYYPAQAEEVLRLGQQLAARLEHLHPEVYRPAHGGFKPSQLLLDGDQVFIVDFDGFCLADPALDVGYFLAYLRPSGLWQHRLGMRQWFEEAAAHFIQAYQEALGKHGLESSDVMGIKERASLYEAALLFKIATRRVHRLNSPRPQELAAILDEIAACM
jgi:thiamine kinase-like enzyme